MNEHPQNIGIFVSGNEAAVVGPSDLVQKFMDELSINPDLAGNAKKATLNAVAAAAGLSAIGSSMAGKTFTLTADSADLVEKFRHFAPEGPLAGVIRGAQGRIVGHAKFEPAAVNPMAMSNVAMLSAAAALKAALADLEQLVEAMDIKLDRLLSDNRAKALGDVQGITQVLEKAYSLYEETGRISETTWAQVSGHATALAQASSHALNQLDVIADSLKKGSAGERADAAKHVSGSELRSWLVLLAACQANQTRLDTLEIVHAARSAPEDLEFHRAATERAAAQQHELAGLRMQRLNDAVADTASINDFSRVINPLRSRSTLNAVEIIVKIVRQFAAIYGLEDLVYGTVERESWRKSLSDLKGQTRQVLGSVAQSVPETVGKAKPQIKKLGEIDLGRPKWARRTKADEPKQLESTPDDPEAFTPNEG
ncbi:hypothetical protein P4U43_00335 [Arthrobacter sp. EH-1B-1]|uniref:Uncharacterized protein n=1 Tax=Arthrobacter vasquezii TaxID=2977629 RepID=A0ABT6CQ15_9MICC|nr:hypothetical protein [Arthrobacter vasquezii]MDF9276235.1 hypothetical protein [Arthrobacter vasquezii]